MVPLSLRAAVVPSSYNPEKHTVQLTWTTGSRVLRGSWDPYWEELDLSPSSVRMQRLQSGTAPVLNNHCSDDLEDVIGVVESAQLDPGGRSGSALIRFDDGECGAEIERKVANGIINNVSVGYRVYKMVQVEGGDGSTPVFRAVDWEPYEISPVPMGADPGAVMRSASVNTYPCEFIQERTMATEPTPAASAPAPAQPVAAPAMPAAAHEDVVRAALDADRQRGARIRQLGTALGRPDAEIEAAVRNGTSIEAFSIAAVDARATAPSGAAGAHINFDRQDPRIQAGQDVRDKWQVGVTAWVIERSGLGPLFAQAAEAARTPRYAACQWARQFESIDLDPGEVRGARMVDLAKQSLEFASMPTRGLLSMDLVGRAFTMATRAPTQSTSDFPLLLENVLYKVLLAQYIVTPDTWTSFCRTGTVQDFRPSKRYRMGTLGGLVGLNELGEFQNRAIPDAERQSITAATKGLIIGISRQSIINDDMGAFSTLATMLGRACKLDPELAVYAALALNGGLGPTMDDTKPLFDAAHKNISTGAALGSTAIDNDRVQMANQKDPSNNEVLGLRPSVLVIPVGLGGTAKQINNGAYDFDAGLGNNNKNPNTPNKVGGLFSTIVDTPRVTGTRRYLFADPAVAPTIEVAFVDGQPQPFMDIQQGWRVDGVEWKARLDYAVGAVDFRGAVTNAGA